MSFRELLMAPKADLTPMRAEVTPMVAYGTNERGWLREDEDSPAAKIRKYDKDGPGLVGAMLDIPAGLASHVELIVQRRTAKGWVRDDSAVGMAIVNMWRGETSSPIELLQRLVRALDGPGEIYQVLEQSVDRSWRYRLLHTTNIHPTTRDTVIVKTVPNARPGSRWHREIPAQFIQRLHQEDPEWPGLAWSPMFRALPDIERYRQAMRTVGRNLDSQLAMNGIIWAEAVAGGTTFIDSMKRWAQKAITDDDGIEAVAPFPMSTVSEPKWIDVGRKDHAQQLAVADASVLAIARMSDLPTMMVTEGPGAANHWNDIAIADWIADYTMRPRLTRAVNMITVAHFRPWARLLSTFDGNPEDYRVWFDDRGIRGDTDTSDDIVKLRELGIATREAVAEAKGLRPDQVLELPAGMSDYESWLATKNAGAVPITVDAEPLGDGQPPSEPPIRASLPTSLIP